MKKFVLALPVFSIVVMVILASIHPAYKTEGEEHGSQDLAAPPPASLDAFYPPNAEGPVYQFRMFGIATPFTGITVDLFENDMENVAANFDAFKAQYLEVSKLIPEWEDQFPMEPVDELGSALKTGDPDQVMAAVGNVGKVCHTCHIVNMVKVQQKYHWKDFEAIAVQDPLTNQEVDYPQFMRFLDAAFLGIGVDVAQGQQENAQKQFEGFNARFQALKESCKECHSSPRTAIVDKSVQARIDELGQVLSGTSIDPNAVGEVSNAIGAKSCGECHLIHLPAAYAKERWEHWEEIKGK